MYSVSNGCGVWLGMVVFALLLVEANPGCAQSVQTPEEQLEQEFTDPLTTLPQVVVRDSFTPANYGTGVLTNQFIVRPIIPRIPPNTLLPFVQLVRPTFALVTVPSPRGGSRTEFGDLPFFDIAILPWPDYKKTGLLIGLGPAFVFPTATSTSAGQGAWQAGPAFGMAYTHIPGVLAAVIIQNPISFAYTSPKRPPQNTLNVQPVLAVHLIGKYYLRSAEANWTMGWHRRSPTQIPLSLGIGRTIVREGWPPASIFVTGQWMAYRQFSPIAPQTTVNFGMTIGFPSWREW